MAPTIPSGGFCAGYWSRRITDEHRLVYAVEAEQIVIVAARHHY